MLQGDLDVLVNRAEFHWMRLYLPLINKWDPCVLQNIVTVFMRWQSLVDVELCTPRQSKNLNLLNLHAPSFVYAFQYLTIRTPYRKLCQIFSDKQLNSLEGSLSLLWLVKQQNKIFSNNLCHAIFTLATCENSQLFKMGNSLTFSLFTLFITPCFHL